MKAERNLCKEAGCQAACCRDCYFFFSYPVKKVLEWFPDAVKVRCGKLPQQEEKGVFYESFMGRSMLRIVGICPNLREKGECQIYGDRPMDCRNLPVGSRTCSSFRRHTEAPALTPAVQ